MDVKISKKSVIKQINNKFILYNSLIMDFLILDSDEFESISEIVSQSSSAELISNHKNQDLIIALKKIRFLVDSEYDDNLTQEYIREYNHKFGSIIDTLYLVITEECNFQCEYCYIDTGTNLKISDEVLFLGLSKFINLIEKNNIEKPLIYFYGGEPLLNFKAIQNAIEFVKSHTQRKIYFNVVSNGSLITQNIAKYMKENSIGCSVSLDGISPDHNYYRKFIDGGCCFDEIMSGIKILKECDVQMFISITINTLNIQDLTKIIQVFITEYQITDFDFQILMPKSSGYNVPLPDPKTLASKMYECFKLMNTYGLTNYRVFKHLSCILSNHPSFGECQAFRGEMAVITPDGFIGPCISLAPSKKGYIKLTKEMELSDIYKSSEWKSIEGYFKPTVLQLACKNCDLIGICSSGCGYSRMMSKNNDYFCKWMEELNNNFLKQIIKDE